MIKRIRLGLVAAVGLLILAACGTTPPPADTDTLTVTVVGNGTVTSLPAGIDVAADSDDSHAFSAGAEVTLTATPAAGWSFDGWDDDECGTDTTCVLTLDGDASITATFTEDPPPGDPVTLTVNVVAGGDAAGSVTSNPAGIDTAGGATDSADFAENTVVTLTAAVTEGGFAGWTGGDCDGLKTLECTVTINEGEDAVTANFNDVESETFTMTEGVEELLAASQTSPALFPAGHNFQESSDMDFGYDGANGVPQNVGLRFDFVGLNEGAAIQSAVLNFVAAAKDNGNGAQPDADLTVHVYGEDSAAPAAFLDDDDGDPADEGQQNDPVRLGNRTRTAESFAWEITGGWTLGEDVDGPDLTDVVQAVVARDGGFGGSLVLIVIPDDTVSTAGRSTNFSNGSSDNWPTLVVSWVNLP